MDPDEPFPDPILDANDLSSGLFYLKRMLIWMDELGLAANIDLHGAPGSQNGFDNSGRAGGAHWVEWGQVEDLIQNKILLHLLFRWTEPRTSSG